MVPAASAEGLGALAMSLGASGVQEDLAPGETRFLRQPWDTGPAPPPPGRVLLRVWWPEGLFASAWPAWTEALRTWPGAEVPSFHWQAESDWAEDWKRHFHRMQIAPNLAVAPPWEAVAGDVIIEPGLAFGTGEHATTRACLVGIARHARVGGRCLDVGCGSGVLALAAARLGMEAWGVDTDPEAVRAAREAAERNGLVVRFDTTPVARIEGRFDLVVANLFAEVLVALAPELQRLCSDTLLCAGILADRADRVLAALTGFRQVLRSDEGDWVSLELRR